MHHYLLQMTAYQEELRVYDEELTRIKLEIECKNYKEKAFDDYYSFLKRIYSSFDGNEHFAYQNFKVLRTLESIWKNNLTEEITEKYKDILELLRGNQSFVYCLNNNEKVYFSKLLRDVDGQLKDLKYRAKVEQRRKEENESKLNMLSQYNQIYFDVSENNSSFDNDSNNCYSLFDPKNKDKQKEEESKQFLEDDEICFNDDPYLRFLQQQMACDVEMVDDSQKIIENPCPFKQKEELSVPLISDIKVDNDKAKIADEKNCEHTQIIKENGINELKKSNIFTNCLEGEIEFEKILAECNDSTIFRLGQNPMMTQEERICFYKNIATQNDYSQIENPIVVYGDSDEDEIKFLSMTQVNDLDLKPINSFKKTKDIEESNKFIRDSNLLLSNQEYDFEKYQIKNSLMIDNNFENLNNSKITFPPKSSLISETISKENSYHYINHDPAEQSKTRCQFPEGRYSINMDAPLSTCNTMFNSRSYTPKSLELEYNSVAPIIHLSQPKIVIDLCDED